MLWVQQNGEEPVLQGLPGVKEQGMHGSVPPRPPHLRNRQQVYPHSA